MATVMLDSFGGIQPRVDATALSAGMATYANDCRLKSTKLAPLTAPVSVADYAFCCEGGIASVKDARTIFLWRRGRDVRNFLAYGGLVHFAPSNIRADSRYRCFVSGETGYTDENGENQPIALVCTEDGTTFDRHPLFKAAPPSPIVNRQSLDPIDADNARYTTFTQTYVDRYGYESPASAPSTELVYNDGDAVIVSQDDGEILPDWVASRRIYKSVAGSSGETDTIKFVFEQERTGDERVFGNSAPVKVKDEDTGETMPSVTAIPADLDWMLAMPGNFFVGFLRSEPRRICFSDVNLPTSWPEAFTYDIHDEAIGIAVAGNTAFVLTRGYPYAITGSAPEGMTASKIVSEQACVSARSICTMDGRVYYASQDGICVLSEDSLTSTVITKAYFSKTDWAALNPPSIIMTAYDGALFFWATDRSGRQTGYIVDFDIGNNPIISTHSCRIRCCHVDCEDDKLYFVGGEDG